MATSTVWYCIPSARPVGAAAVCFERWRERGYRTACLRDEGDGALRSELGVDLMVMQPRGAYRGYAASLNALCALVLRYDPQCQIIVAGGDDMRPDPNYMARDIAEQFLAHFKGTLGVLQPTGDAWPQDRDASGRNGVERIAGSPWLGRAWCERAYLGRGPEFPGYYHSFNDEELQLVAERAGLFWQRPDLVHYHEHWAREAGWGAEPPDHWKPVRAAWERDKTLFTARATAGFPMSRLRPA
jgi:hypothetical protein